jgi:hypothetical protein
MFAAFFIDHRLALFSLTLLVVGAAVPLTFAWARILPEDAPPLASGQSSRPRGPEADNHLPEDFVSGDPFAVFLLVCVTLSYVLKFPSLPLGAALWWLATLIPEPSVSWIVSAARAFFLVTPGLAACYSAIRPNPVRVPLITASILVLLLWLLDVPLHAALVAP